MADLYEVYINGIPSGFVVRAAVSFHERLRGFLGRKAERTGILFPSCRAIHTFFMSFPLDVVFLDHDNRVIRVDRELAPGRAAGPVAEAASILEIPSSAHAMAGLSAGDRLAFFKRDATLLIRPPLRHRNR